MFNPLLFKVTWRIVVSNEKKIEKGKKKELEKKKEDREERKKKKSVSLFLFPVNQKVP